jgi:hypothetical protein
MLATALLAGSAGAIEQAPPPTTFDTRTAPGFGNVTVPLRAYLQSRKPRPRGTQHFCVVGYDHGLDDSGKRSRSAQVHWREGKRLILWEGANDWGPDVLRYARRDVDLRNDVVATEADVNSSTYLVTRAFVDRILVDCAAKGTRYTIRMRKRT